MYGGGYGYAYSTMYTKADQIHAAAFYQRATWKLKFLWKSRICDLLTTRLWLCVAYEGQAVWTGPGESVTERRWHTKEEHIIWKLTH
jgi:hypothetical protein